MRLQETKHLIIKLLQKRSEVPKRGRLTFAIVKKIVPNTTLDFTWYLNLFPRQEGDEDRDYREIKTFIIGYKTAKEFRKTRHTLLRENQWQDLMVRIMA